MRLRLLALVALLPLGACSTVEEAVHGPNLTPMGYPSQLVARDQVVLASARETPTPASANSLWRAGARGVAGCDVAE